MSWASRRRTTYLGGIILFFGIILIIPVANYFLSIKPTCFDGKQNGGETAVDEGGPCLKLNPADISPAATLWARSFKVRDGSYTAVAYIVNPNQSAGIPAANYKLSLYDSGNVLVAEKTGTTFILPGGITPVVEIGIDTGNRTVVHTYFQLTDAVLDWEKETSPASDIHISNQQVDSTAAMPRVTATAVNASFSTMHDVVFAAVVFDAFGNAIAASKTDVPSLDASSPQQITFTWPGAFSGQVGRVDITALLPPVAARIAP